MSIYCNVGQKTTLNYAFDGDGAYKTIIFDNYIDLSITTNSGSWTDYNPNGYKLSVKLYDPFSQSRGGYGQASFVCRGYLLGTLNPNYGYPLTIIGCDNIPVNVGYVLVSDIGSISIDRTVKCSTVIDIIATITVKDPISGVTLFSVTGKSPTTNVICGDECPPGFCKCPTTNYPGYCCLPCGQIAAQLANIVAIARSKR